MLNHGSNNFGTPTSAAKYQPDWPRVWISIEVQTLSQLYLQICDSLVGKIFLKDLRMVLLSSQNVKTPTGI